MKRKLLVWILCFIMIVSTLSGCRNQNDRQDDKPSGRTVATPSPEDADTEDAIVTPEAPQGTYAYEQELNIIDDNYRNYYEIFVYSYYDSNGDGIGDFNGITSKLDYISDMGFNGIWLMPIMPSPTYHKYDATDYYSVDPTYGTLEDFQNLVNECHSRGIKLIIDLVLNHSSTKHPWFTEAVAYLKELDEGEEPDYSECPTVGYYVFTKEKKSSKFYKVGNSEWYYEAQFWDQMPDLALDNPEFQTEIKEITKYWLDMGVDGFRLDAIKDYYTGDTNQNLAFIRWFDEYVLSVNPEAYIVGECWDNTSVVSTYYQSGIMSLFNYPVALLNGVIIPSVRKLNGANAKTFLSNLTNIYSKYGEANPDYIDAPFISNHDNPRMAMMAAYDPELIKMSAGVLLTMTGSPFVYYGDEIGMGSQGTKDENKRLPMNWSLVDQTGMTTPPQGADAVEQKLQPVDEQQKDPLSILNYYKRALRIRNENPEIARGEFSVVDALTTENVCAVKKAYRGSELVVVYNMNKDIATVDLNSVGLSSLQIRGYLTVDGSEVTISEGILGMPKYSIVILK